MSKIKEITCHKIINSRGEWTLYTKVTLEDGSFGEQTIPDGASKGQNEAVTIPVNKAVDVVSSAINEALQGFDVFDHLDIDNLMNAMDGTKNKSNIGANSTLSVSLACAKAAAASKKMPLYRYLNEYFVSKYHLQTKMSFPTPVFNVLNGGLHARNNLSFQEFMVIPSPNFSYEKALEIGVHIYQNLKKSLQEQNKTTSVGDEGGFAPTGFNPLTALKLIRESTQKLYTPGTGVFFGMDVAAGSFVKDGKYYIREMDLYLDGDELLKMYTDILNDFELIYLEDPFFENHFEYWAKAKKQLGGKLMIVGDDLVVTNKNLLKKALEMDLLNAVIIKPNQVGTLSETFDFINLAKENGLALVLSHRSGDTAEDTFIADLAIAVGAQFIKSGAPARGERVSKYNRLLEIQAELKDSHTSL